GCVAWMFNKKGVIILSESSISEDELLDIVLEAGAEDVNISEGSYEIYTAPEFFHQVKEALEEKNIKIESASVTMVPRNTITLDEEDKALKVLKMMSALEENDDTQDVYANFDIPSDMMEKIA
ncbi:MAG: YebC/PmpR family DNA-binding transcriptional regulator, partial [Candidatus Eremiobacteraeota bacterium]|nr:YebC/PmpR family DNA-binding transcriptional regulator [Candidatus Eremiobacteraeota bacterium]